MGLDMYLYRYPKNMTKEEREAKSNELWEKGIDVWRKEFKDKFQVAYWRKVNFLHGWIVKHLADGVDECQEIDMSLDDFLDLQSLCKTSIEIMERSKFVPQKRKDKEKREYSWQPEYERDESKPEIPVKWNDGELGGIEKNTYYILDKKCHSSLSGLLPTTDGFFFGSYEYDLWYAFDMFNLRDTLKRIIDGWDESYNYIYSASW